MNKSKLISLLSLLFGISILSYGKAYKGAEYRTHDTFLYGRFEVSMKPANRVGVISSFFTYHEISTTTDWNEIDIENIGCYDDIIQFNTITSGQVGHVRNEPIKFNQYEEFHTYAFEWTPDYIAWIIDGVETYRQTGEHIATMNLPQKIMMNIWNPEYENWVGVWDNSSLPTFSYYDWVSYASYTPNSGNTGTNNNFTSDWHDDFETYNSDRWGKATHTFTGNKCDFIEENVVFQDGKLILCLTDDSNLGYQDNAKPVLYWTQAFSDGSIELKFSEELDIAVAETISNYSLPGASITSALLGIDSTIVRLETESFDPTVATNLIVMNVQDRWGNTIAPAAKTIIPAVFLEFPIQINVGGGEELNYLADQEWTASLSHGCQDSYDATWPLNTEISNTDEDIIYLMDGEGTVKYQIKVPNDQYDVTLMFAEKYFDASAKRIFDVTIEGNRVESNVDIFSEVGKNAAYNITKTIAVEDELLEIVLSPQINRVVLSGIKVILNPNSVGSNGNQLDEYELFQNYPNPFNPSTEIGYSINSRSHVKLKIYDILGNEIATLVNEIQNAGKYRESFNSNLKGKKLVSGVYFYRLQTDKFIETKKMLVIK